MTREDSAARLIVDREELAARIIFEAACDFQVTDQVEALLREASQAGVRKIELDFGAASFADSTAVRLALKARDHVAPKGGQVIVKAPPEVSRIFDLTDTASLFEMVLLERQQAADRRDQEADERDRVADERDRAADERERAADERDRAADERDRT